MKQLQNIFPLLIVVGVALGSDILEHKVDRLAAMSAQNPVIHLKMDNFKELVASKPRNYSIFLLLTALSPQRDCSSCREAYNELKMLVSPWRFSSSWTKKVFFAVADFDTSSEIFSILKQDSVPAFVHISPSASVYKLQPSDYMDIHRKGYSANAIADWIYSETQVRIRFIRPPSYSAVILLSLFMFIGAVALWSRKVSLDGLYNSSLWCMLALTIIFGAISGQMYNQIRGPPLLHATPKGEIVGFMFYSDVFSQKAFIYPGSDYQFVAETVIVMILYMLCTAGIVLVHKVTETADVKKKKVFLFAGVAILCVAFSLLLSVFRKKYHGYPYRYARVVIIS
ncbi:Tumor suppressor candidate 3 (Protein N33) [Fasciolopsis buskii]|uniref:Tumor suppressor candidate 3 (Protein N33) n=1 Tax=Fasciolopsis buskii TaxID=27845 RepID=A0A8E0RTL2_9TREM|nr:Tumor suppressor candidate 3 (Protein N33) [Fasciolopsis buski]